MLPVESDSYFNCRAPQRPSSSFNEIDSDIGSQCNRPQLAHEMYQRLLAIAISRTQNIGQHHQQRQYNSDDIRLAAYTGFGLYYSS